MQEASNHAHIRIVQSRQNARVKDLRAALKKSEKTASGLIAVEGLHLMEEALRSGLRVETVFIRSGSLELLGGLGLAEDAEILELPADVFASAVTTESPQGIAALVAAPAFSLEDVLRGAAPLVLVAAGLQNPGNLGTIVRSAEAFGASGVVALPGTVSVWNAKALRASSGSAFRLPVVSADVSELFGMLRSRGVRSLATVVDRGVAAQEVDLIGPVALFIGNEGAGLSAQLVAACDARVTIPCPGPVESLNAAIAASVLLYEASRQRG
ncbi:RNA methyltransferase [Acidobacterium sp. S8]|uniref:TrmH family RNA methyltransferase n=1 Tax=Acidobacterium sp. S8 TaxID=1641854 RepID=UPI0015759B51|nr:RNA methyltransferase [Acidobacterium sp. S8]